MLLQKIQLPLTQISQRELFVRVFGTQTAYFDHEQNFIVAKIGALLNFDTYFNCFSIEKWLKYTVLDNLTLNLTLSGNCSLTVVRLELGKENRWEQYPFYTQNLSSSQKANFAVKIPATAKKGIIGFRLEIFDDTIFYGGEWSTNINENNLNDVNLALCMCSFKRENYVYANMEMLQNNVFLQADSPIIDHLRVYLVDNGNTLENRFNSDKIKLIPNKNSGGAGGFTRGMIESLADQEKFKLSHIILMDDDVFISHHALERTYSFLRLIKPEYFNSMLGGAMLNIEQSEMLYAAGETWTLGGIQFNKQGLNMLFIENLLKSELQESTNMLGWWYCCFPITEDTKNNLSLPLFFQGDDQEFNLRNNIPKINLNGICLWHESFTKKRSPVKDYFWDRNLFTVCSIHLHGRGFSKRFLRRKLIKQIALCLMLYRYNEARLKFKAIDDFLQGLEYIAALEFPQLMGELSAIVDKALPIEQLPINFAYKDYEKSLINRENPIRQTIRRLSFNGWLLPARGSVTVPATEPIKSYIFMKKHVLNYDLESGTGFVTTKSFGQALSIIGKLIATLIKINLKFNKAVAHNKAVHKKMITEEFWKEYLNL
ncbi:MAG: hypothetical protein FWG64_05595 [Firmicutes bacterium]|nr:hypothetical protein [Bacillota bacterium]